MYGIQQELDKEIELHKKKIAELEQLKLDQEKKIEGFTEFDQTIQRLCNQMALPRQNFTFLAVIKL